MSATDSLELAAVPPFDLAMTVAALRRRPHSLTDALVDGEYRRVLSLDGVERLVGVRQLAPDRVRVRALDGPLGSAAGEEAARLVERMLGLRVDLAPVAARVAGDAHLAALFRRLAGMKPPRFPSLWVTFACVVPYQQVSLEAGVAVMNRVIQALGTRHLYEGQTYFGFPTPERFRAADVAMLRGRGLSAAKVRTLTHVAELILSGELTEAEIEPLEDAAAVARLTALPGIGPWSAHLVLLRGLRRLSVFPAGDSGASRNLRLLFDVPADDLPRLERALLETLGPWRGELYFLLLGRSLLARGLIQGSPTA
ncbi:MAG: DNA-3-methyladenine glycosylase 2 family protein [Ktedonobacterales bacterium]|nr:DNA-3-methyladenine glycosylase 2 family protein [Ktedonobacterales bacterium]